jgi:hypothetical protein
VVTVVGIEAGAGQPALVKNAGLENVIEAHAG